MNVWAVVSTKDRPAELAGLLSDLDPDRTVIVDNGSVPPVLDAAGSQRVAVKVLRILDDPPNLSALWNAGLDEVAHRIGPDQPYEVAVLNDDLRIPAGVLEGLAAALRATGAAIAFPDVHGLLRPGQTDMLTTAGPHNLFHRMTGFCFLLRGELGLRIDERFRWWYGDDDLEWRAALAGGVLRVGGLTVDHLYPNGSTAASPVLTARANADRHTFIAKWGHAPW